MPVHFTFKDSRWEEAEYVPSSSDPKTFVKIDKTENRVWGSEEMEQWRKSFAETVEQTWSNKHTLYCHKIGWGTPGANVIVRIADVGKDIPEGKFVFRITVYRGDNPSGSSVSRVNGGFVELAHQDLGDGTAAHEFGHMLGLGDEYEETGKPPEATHSELVKKEFGYPVWRSGPDRGKWLDESIMSTAQGKLLPEHGVIFLEAMRSITKIPEWSLKP